MPPKSSPKTIDAYIAGYPPEVQAILQKMRATIHKAAPKAEETMSYKMPTFTLNGKYLVYFAAFKQHISLYPAPNGLPEFKDALAQYAAGRGTLKFSLAEPIPYRLITRLVKYRVKENLGRAEGRKK